MIIESGGPCPEGQTTLDIINAISNGFQILALMVLSHFTRRNGRGGYYPRRSRHGPRGS